MNGTLARTLVVVGDSLLDIDTDGEATRLSPDGPVPVVEHRADWSRPGGAALTACLAARDGRPVRLVTPLANDDDGRRLRALLPATVELVPLAWAGRTPVKNRLRAGGHTVARLDRGGDAGRIGPVPTEAFDGAAAVVVADYGYGTTADDGVRTALTAVAGRVPTVWDPHPRGGAPLPGTTLVVPNEHEAAPGERGAALGTLADRAAQLRATWGVGDVAVTAGARGAVTTVGDGPAQLVPVSGPRADGDTCGAGDHFAVTAAWALADGAVPSEAVAAGVAAASAFVAGGGLAAVDGLGTRDSASARRVVVATGGCFDLLHPGHVATLEAARRLGDELVVCLNSDDSVRRLKGPDRPLQPATDRARVLEALACVDRVVVFDEDVPDAVLRLVRPDIWVKGGDYAGTTLPEAAVLAEWGGRAVTVPYVDGRSTTGLVGRARRTAPGRPR